MPAVSTSGLTNAQVSAYINTVSIAAITQILGPMQAFQTALASAEASLAGLPGAINVVQSINNAGMMLNGQITNFQNLLTQATLLSTSVLSSMPALTVGVAATAFTPVYSTGGVGTVSYAISPALPAGLSFSASTGQITGTPTAASPATNYTVTATDQSTPTPQTASSTFGLTVAAAS